MLPTIEVLGVGLAEFPIPPEDVVYHNKELPELAVAVKAFAKLFWQSDIGETTLGAVGFGLMVMVTSGMATILLQV